MPRVIQELPKSKAGIACLSVLLSRENEAPKGKLFLMQTLWPQHLRLVNSKWSSLSSTALANSPPCCCSRTPLEGFLLSCNFTANLFCYLAVERHGHKHILQVALSPTLLSAVVCSPSTLSLPFYLLKPTHGNISNLTLTKRKGKEKRQLSV